VAWETVSLMRSSSFATYNGKDPLAALRKGDPTWKGGLTNKSFNDLDALYALSPCS
jgi:hypothetical protein